MGDGQQGRTDGSVHDREAERIRALSVAVLSDVLDSMELRQQLLDISIRPLAGSLPLIGRAFPIQALATPIVGEEPYAEEIAAVDALTAGSVAMIAATGNCSAALWGELLASRAIARGATGVVVDGAVRDVGGLREIDFTTFSIGVSAADARGRLSVVSHGEPIRCGGVLVQAGDLVLGDLDGIVVVPAARADEALTLAEQKRASERRAQEMLEDGVSVAEVFDRLNVL
jgi:4-hydroxy-4-methyl-2-oxoglutarate aldolase